MPKLVLLAEDEPNIIESLTFLLERAGFAVAAEQDGQAALEAALSGKPDLIILDVMLSGIDGFEILRRLRADAACGTTPIIMLTAKGQREDREAALREGANLYITKPFSNAELIEAVRGLLGGEER
jgi:DNA-binding response OmpR family regulator